MDDLCGISATPGRGNGEISVETRFRGQCRSQSWNPYGPVLGYRSRLLGFHRSLGSEAVSSSGVRWVPWVPTRARGGIADDLWTVCMPVGRAPQRLLLRRRSESSQAVSLGLVTTELVINALKHAFVPGYEGEIVVRYDVDGAVGNRGPLNKMGKPMTALKTIEAYLRRNPGMVYCGDCLSSNLAIRPRQQVQQKTYRLADSPSFERRSNLCACCRRTKLAIGAKAPILS
jgi:hypothetical protein